MVVAARLIPSKPVLIDSGPRVRSMPDARLNSSDLSRTLRQGLGSLTVDQDEEPDTAATFLETKTERVPPGLNFHDGRRQIEQLVGGIIRLRDDAGRAQGKITYDG